MAEVEASRAQRREVGRGLQTCLLPSKLRAQSLLKLLDEAPDHWKFVRKVRGAAWYERTLDGCTRAVFMEEATHDRM